MGLLTLYAYAATAPALAQQAGPMQLPPVSVEGRGQAPQAYKPEKAESPKRTAPLRDTPQVITVLPEQLLKDQNLLTLREALSTVPGITFGAGEGGGGYGDSITLRGYNANADVTTDSLRDSAHYTRSDFFNTEQIEVFNGANSVYSGSGSVGGTINLVSKQPKNETFTTLIGGVGTADYVRGAVDTNQKVTDTIAIRLNAMAHKNDIAGRDVEQNKRWGVAPAVTFGIGTPTTFTLSYIHQEDDNIPQYGVPYYISAFNAGPLPGVDPSDYFGYRNIDTQEIGVDSLTAKFEHEFDDTFSVRSLTRLQQVDQYAIVNPPQGTYCLASGINPATGAACAVRDTYMPSGPRGNTRDTTNKLIATQLDLLINGDTGGLAHNAAIGLSGSHESFALDTGNVLRNPNGAPPNPVLPAMTLSNPNSVYTGPVNFVRSATQDGSVDNIAVYAFDTVTIVPEFELNAGVRYEYNSGDFTSATFTNGAFTSQTPVFTNDDHLFSYRVGAVYKPVEQGSIYIAYGNSKTPSKSAVNGSCVSGTVGTAAFINNCNVDPETAENYEIGVKWDLSGEKLGVNAALFRNDRTNYKVPSNDPLVPFNVLDGKARVDGVALGVNGNVTDQWQVFANYTYLDSEVLQSVSDFTLRTTGIDAQAGNPLVQTPKHAASLWTTYTFREVGVTVGYGATYQSKIYLSNGAPPRFVSPGFWVHRAMAAYQLTDAAVVQLNVSNLFDNAYYIRVRNNGWATPAEARQATLTVQYTF